LNTKPETRPSDELGEALWQVEIAKRQNLPISRAMNFIRLSKEAQGYGNQELATGMVKRAKEGLFQDLVGSISKKVEGTSDIETRMTLERGIREAKRLYNKGDLKGAYRALIGKADRELDGEEGGKEDDSTMRAQALEKLQKVWLRLKNEEKKGRDTRAQAELINKARAAIGKKQYKEVVSLCDRANDMLQSPKDRIREETENLIEEVDGIKTELFSDENGCSPKEIVFHDQIERLMEESNRCIRDGRTLDALHKARNAKDVLKALERDTIKDSIPNLIIQLKAKLESLQKRGIDLSYEEYLMKQMEDASYKEDYLGAKKTANKLSSSLQNAEQQNLVLTISSRLSDLNNQLKGHVGKEGYMEAKEALNKAKSSLEMRDFDGATSYLDRAANALPGQGA